MPDYSPLGIEKIIEQASRDIRLIRCPRDSVVMRVRTCSAEPAGGGPSQVVEGRVPRARGWIVREMDLECPACRRRADGIPVVQHAASHR